MQDLHGQYVDMSPYRHYKNLWHTYHKNAPWWRKYACKPLFTRRRSRLTLTLYFLHRSERAGEQRRSSREGWLRIESNAIYSLLSALLDMNADVNDTIIISGHCMQLDYYSMQIKWPDFLSNYSHTIFFFQVPIIPRKFSNNLWVPSCVCCACVNRNEVVCGEGKREVSLKREQHTHTHTHTQTHCACNKRSANQ